MSARSDEDMIRRDVEMISRDMYKILAQEIHEQAREKESE